jgi:GPH family glycoside/pentoside/hexuronide:cation symporter
MSQKPESPTQTRAIDPKDRVPLGEKIAYGAGGASGALHTYADSGLLNPVFVVTCGISPAMMSLAALIYRLWDAVTDALMGWITDNTRTRWGRRKPYIVVGAFAMALSMPVIFFFDRSWSVSSITAWMIATSLLMFLFSTVWNIPYQCMLLEITPDSTERTNVAAWRAYFGKITTLVMAWVWYLTQLPVFNDAAGKPDILLGARWVICVIAVGVIFLGLLPLFAQQRTHHARKSGLKLSLMENLRLTLTNRPFVILVLFSLLFTLGSQIKGGIDFYTRLYYVCGGDQKLASTISGFAGTIITFSGLAGIPVFQWVARKKGKIFALFLIMGIVFCASISTVFLYTPAMPYLSMLPGILIAPANTALWVLIPSMLGDVVDQDEVFTNERREGSFTSVYSWTYKLSLSSAAALSGPIVVLAGFDSSIGTHQPENVLFNMRVLLVVVPAIFIGASIWLLSRYPLTTKRIEEIRVKLQSRSASAF